MNDLTYISPTSLHDQQDAVYIRSVHSFRSSVGVCFASENLSPNGTAEAKRS
ncbi:hypothetical protein JHK86_040871 [Glycine max]|nr:hypothetical protein JHK86_040871 [Glycine max]